MRKVCRGDVVLVDLGAAKGREMNKTRPCIVVQNDFSNDRSRLTIVVPLTDASKTRSGPVNPLIAAAELGNSAKDSIADCGQIRVVDCDIRIVSILGHVSAHVMARIEKALCASLALGA